jgi:hypothetical protein
MSNLTLHEGFEFPPSRFQIDAATVADFLQATGETSPLFKDSPFIPPMAIAARAIGSLGIGTLVPAGVIHVTQQLEFLKPAKVGSELECRTRVERFIARAGLTMITVAMNVSDDTGTKVLSGKIGFILPLEGKTP